MADRPPPHGRAGTPGRLLVVIAEAGLRDSLQRLLREDGHEVDAVGSLEAARARLVDDALELVVGGLVLGRHSGLELLESAAEAAAGPMVLIVADPGSVETAVLAMRRGAWDYLARPLEHPRRLLGSVRRGLARCRLARAEEERAARPDAARATLEAGPAGAGTGAAVIPEPGSTAASVGLVGRSAAMARLLRTLEAIRASESTVLLQGESGTGKELVARALHANGPRRAGPFVPVDCGAIPEGLVESELFGHERGAFTGALGARGLFRLAHRGTIFLDEIGELPLPAQAKLLRALQQREVRPVGAATTVPIDLRVVAATHRDLRSMVAAGRFREDLYWRLDVVRIALPALRERREDIPDLAHHFLQRHRPPGSPVRGFEPAALERLVAHDWPGNVRELENVVESACARAAGPWLRARELRLDRSPLGARTTPLLPLSLEAYERSALERALAEAGGDATRAASLLGLGRSTFYRRLARHGIARGGSTARPGPSTIGGRDAFG